MSMIRIGTMTEFNELQSAVKAEIKNYCISITLMAGAAQIAGVDLRHLAPKFDRELLSQFDVDDAVIAEITREYVMDVFAKFAKICADYPREKVYIGN